MSGEEDGLHEGVWVRTFDDPSALQALCGSNNARLKLVERTAGAQVHLRGNEITIEGDEAATETAKAAIEQLYDLALAGNPLSSDDVVRAVKLLQGDGSAGQTIQGVFGEVPENLPSALYARKVQRRAASTGFDFLEAPEAVDALNEELRELEAAETPDERFDELGDVLVHSQRACLQARADAGDTREVAQCGEGAVLPVRAVHDGTTASQPLSMRTASARPGS